MNKNIQLKMIDFSFNHTITQDHNQQPHFKNKHIKNGIHKTNTQTNILTYTQKYMYMCTYIQTNKLYEKTKIHTHTQTQKYKNAHKNTLIHKHSITHTHTIINKQTHKPQNTQ